MGGDPQVNPTLEAAIPEGGYLARYIDYGTEVTMAPPEFHLAAGLAQISTILRNEVGFYLGGRFHPTHLWMVMLGKAGAKKSSAISLATGLLTETGAEFRLPSETSREALWDVLARQPCGVLELTEFMGFIQTSNRDYQAGLKEDLIQFFDSLDIHQRELKSGQITVRRPAVTILGAAVTDVVVEWVRARDLAGGFLSRFLFVPQTTGVAYKGMTDPSYGDVRYELRNELLDIQHAKQERRRASGGEHLLVSFTAEAQEAWERYDEASLNDPAAQSPEFSGFYSRSGLYSLKIAILNAIAEKCWTVEIDHVLRAVAFVDYCRDQIIRVVDERMTSSKEGLDIVRVHSLLTRLGGAAEWVPYSQVLKRSHMTSRHLADIISTMDESGRIEVRTTEDVRPRKELRLAPEPE